MVRISLLADRSEAGFWLLKLESKTARLAMLICRNHVVRMFEIVLAFSVAIGGSAPWALCQEKAQSTSYSSQPIPALKTLQTVAEKSNYMGTAREKDVLSFLKDLDDASPLASQLSIGKTTEGRSIQALVVAKEGQVQLPLPANDDRLVIVLLGGIHSGESDGKEALLALARDLLAEGKPGYLDQAVLVFVPNFNADGNERVGVLHRPGQDGPDLGMGIRENAVGLDLNRDFIKLDSPEVRALVRAIDAWDADVLIDTHTTNGSLHQYDLTYDVPHNPAANQKIVEWLRKSMLPSITKDMLKQGFPTFYYGNFSDDHKRWDSFGHEPRYSTEYMGLRGKIGILVESYSYASYQRRIDASYLFVDACLKQLTSNHKSLQKMMQVDNASKPMGLPIQGKIVADAGTQIAKGFTWASNASDANKGTPAIVEEDDDHVHGPTSPELAAKFPGPKDRKRKSELTPTDFEVSLFNVGASTLSVDAPEYYFIPANNAWAAGRLRMHGIQMSWFDEQTAVPPANSTQYRITARKDLPEFQNHRMRKFETKVEPANWKPSAGWLVSTRQPLGALATYLLEPHSDDSLAVWNFFDPELTADAVYPVLRIESLQNALGAASLPNVMPPLKWDDSPSAGMAKEQLSLEKIYDPQKRVSYTAMPTPMPRWIPDRESYLVQHAGQWHSVDCQSGAMQPFDRPKRLEAALAKLDAFGNGQAASVARRINLFDSKFENALIEHKEDIYLYKTGNDNGGENSATKDTVRQITHSPDQKKELAELSPTGKHVAYIHGNNIWVADCDSTEVRKLTEDGATEILNGKLDWVYQEEIYGRGQFKGYWWSPDGTMIAYLRLDETNVPRFQIDNSLSFAQSLEETRYPKSGQANPLVTLHVVHVDSGKQHEIPLDSYATDDRLVVRVGWKPAPESSVVFQIQNRIQSKLDVLSFDTNSKKLQTLTNETSPAWVDVIEEPKWLADGSFLWLSDSNGGRRHVYRISDGVRTAVTSGDWDVKSIQWVSDDGKQMWILGHRSAPANLDLLRVDLNNLQIEPIGEATGSHRVNVHPSGNYFFDSWSDSKTQSQLWLRDHAGVKTRYVGSFRNDRFDYVQTGDIDLFEIKARDGFAMQSLLYTPADFQTASKTRKFPVLIHVYGGPAAPTVENTWTHRSDLWHRYLAEQGICVLFCDNRSALGRGNSDTWKIYKDMGSTELRDLEDAVGWLKEQPWVDSENIGMWGWSYGGYFTAYAMTHSKLFKAGIAGAPVTDWNNYDSVYTERYMSTPKANPDGYKSSSVVTAAKDLHGRLMIIHGEIDDNVHMANSMQFVHALQKARKQFELMVYPNNRHGVTDPDQSYHQYKMMTDFFERNLKR